MNSEDETFLVNFLSNNLPELYLGAGFSYGSKTSGGRKIPLGNDFKELLLIRFFSADTELQEELRAKKLEEVCEIVKQDGVDAYNDFITDTFQGYYPEPFHLYLTDYRWPSIYTVNVDDIVEQIFYSNRLQLTTYEARRNNDGIDTKDYKLFKLHGSVRNKAEGYTFSSSEYDQLANDTTDYRLMKFIISLQERPLVVIGTELNERDLDSFIHLYKRANKTLFLHSVVFINPRPTAYFKRIAKGYPKWRVIEATTQEFLEFLHQKHSSIFSTYYSKLNNIKRNGLQSIDIISNEISTKVDYKSNLYFGHSPTWEDAIYEFIVRTSLVDEIVSLFENEETKCFAFHGRLYSGKSSILRTLFTIISQRKDCYALYVNTEEFSVSSLRKAIAAIAEKSVYVFIDDGADYYSLFEKILEIDDRIRIISVGRTSLHLRKRYSLDHKVSVETELERTLTESDISRIRTKLLEKGYAGELNEKPLDDWIRKIGKNTDIVGAMYRLNRSDAFKDYYKNHFRDQSVASKEHYPILLIAAMLYEAEVPYVAQALLYKVSFVLTESLKDACKDYLQIVDDKAIRVISPFVSEAIIENAKRSEIIRYLLIVVESISGVVTEREKNYWKTTYEFLTKFRTLKSTFRVSNSEANEIYATLLPYYQDRSYYWLQKGLLEQDNRNFELANNHFDSALAIHSRSFAILHAKARNYCKQAIYLDDISKANFYFEAGEEIFLDLINNFEYQQNKTYSTHSLIHEKMEFCKKYRIVLKDNEFRRLFAMIDSTLARDKNDLVMRELKDKLLHFSRQTLSIPEFDYDRYQRTIDD